jgi:hypothetical protein
LLTHILVSKEEKRTKNKAVRLVLSCTVLMVFLLLAGEVLATPVSSAFVPSLSAGGVFSIHSATPNFGNRTLTSPNAQLDAWFGHSVAVSGNIVAVGAPYENASGNYEAGHAYMFSATTGKLIKTLASPNVQPYGFFGFSVALSGDILVVGAPYENASGYLYAGNAYAFNVTTGKLLSNFTSPNPQFAGFFGHSVAVSGNTVVIGAPDENASGFGEAGNAYTFNAATGGLIKTLSSPNAKSDGNFGQSVAASGDIAVIGASGERRAYAFDATTGALLSTLTSPNSGSGFGDSVAVSGKIAVVGAPSETSGGHLYAGNAYVFNAATGKLVSNLTSPNSQALGFFGYSVSISGKIAVAGAIYETAGGQSDAGHAYSFNAKTGSLTGTFTSPKAQSGGRFGYSVAVSGKIVVVGASYETAKGQSEAGHAYIF